MSLQRSARAVVLAASGLVAALALTGCTGGGNTPTPSAPAETIAPTESSVPSEPAETDAGDPTDNGQAEPTAEPEAADTRAQVKPFITYAGPGTDPDTIEVAGFVPEVIEEGGTCTATVSGTDISADAPGYADASSTSCGLMVLDVAPAGQTVVLTYSSKASTGTSDAVAVIG